MTIETIATGVLFFLGQAIALVVWLVRLEGRVNYTQKQVDTLQVKHDALDSKIVEELARLREGMARIEGFLQTTKQ